ncbi:MAG: hypothetical protein AUI21_09565 [Nitrospirae bacterium 13_1_40CM_2_62_10]|nr:MAG: hypothetical protein AUI21_09565 [Nitrospirae bacterium 13_1_40CM_2_62_10]
MLLNRVIRLVAQLVERGLHLHPLRFKLHAVRVTRHRDRLAPRKARPAERQRDFEPVPAPEEFFFEAAKVRGMIGSPVSFASSTTPGCATHRGPRGPSGVTARSAPSRPSRAIWRSARAPPRVVEPRMVSKPNLRTIRWISSPSRCSLIRM